jgi:CheY-like chemotaxis protein
MALSPIGEAKGQFAQGLVPRWELNEFLATLAHELRNPLAPLRNAVQILRMQASASPQSQWAQDVIDRQINQMTRLIDDLLDVSRITRNKLELRRERIDLADVVRAAVETSRPLIDAGKHELLVTLPAQPIPLDADLTRLAQSIANLLNNAARYTEPGGHISLAAERQGSDVLISVKDNGVGIPPEMISRIFDMFTQVDRSITRSQGGLGIGLTLVKRLIEMHGGTISAHSDGVGHGAEFLIRLPVAIESTTPSTGPDSRTEPHTSLRILIADDNQDAAVSLGMLCQIAGNEVRTAFDGEEALDVARQFHPDVIILDIGMPKLSGYECARRLREEPWGRSAMLIAVTGWGQDDDRCRSKAAGFDHHIVKPIDMIALNKLLEPLNKRDVAHA